ncbi:hypothetical protein PTTG_03000 [Puccinia triticina 1-1 BBBD Race 1]|uniref:Uncharacterized protein n=2 Tax=Puccinia triticina TaxID=208348 RepID=A0A180GSR1_PUCT1|nr:uncharacterized protein PtA15_11A512 [Puccinia triticina]OAV95800.1 hypothetical protein PTTG_03000 [Puccinia triticina 1-1 BBBD Race 1]WAQ89821.1 hypothetical protein PtA15_11A512 [Puccinia triticina]
MVSVKLAQLISIAVFASTCINIHAETITTGTIGMNKPNEGSLGSLKKPKPPVTLGRRSSRISLLRRNKPSTSDSPPRIKALDSAIDGFKLPLRKQSGSSSEAESEAIPKKITGKPITRVLANTGDIISSNGAVTGNSKPPTIRKQRESSIDNVVWERQHPASGPHPNEVDKKPSTEHQQTKRKDNQPTEPITGPTKKGRGKEGRREVVPEEHGQQRGRGYQWRKQQGAERSTYSRCA